MPEEENKGWVKRFTHTHTYVSPISPACVQELQCPALTRGLILSRWVVSTAVPSVTGPASAFFRLSFTSMMLSSRSTSLLSSIRHSSSTLFSFCSRLARTPLSAERMKLAAEPSISAKAGESHHRVRVYMHPLHADHRSALNMERWEWAFQCAVNSLLAGI